MTPGRQKLYTLWHQPGHLMHTDWWARLGLSMWLEPYERLLSIRAPLNALISKRLGHSNLVPQIDPLTALLLENDAYRDTLCLGLGLWVLRCPEYLLMRTYRQALSAVLDERAQNTMLLILPQGGEPPLLSPQALLTEAMAAGGAWLSEAAHPTLRACRLFWGASGPRVFPGPVEPALKKLSSWL